MEDVVPKKIIFFDSWTQGSDHFERLLPDFKKRGLEPFLLHLGSWGNDKGCLLYTSPSPRD